MKKKRKNELAQPTTTTTKQTPKYVLCSTTATTVIFGYKAAPHRKKNKLRTCIRTLVSLPLDDGKKEKEKTRAIEATDKAASSRIERSRQTQQQHHHHHLSEYY